MSHEANKQYPAKHIAIVAGEHSGDLLGASLIKNLKELSPNTTFEGIGGPLMIGNGLKSLHPVESLSVIGLTDFKKIINAINTRKELAQYFTEIKRPDIFIGVDVPDFNLGLAERLKKNGITTIQYVSPQVWAWRGYRIKKIHKAVDHMLTLFPFEEAYYEEQSIPVTCVGHPLTNIIKKNPEQEKYRRALSLPANKKIVAMLPGSRSGEISRHAQLFFDVARILREKQADLHFVFAFVSNDSKKQFWDRINKSAENYQDISCITGKAREAMAASDVILVSSGTATLEAALLAKPMVVTYKVSSISYHLMKKLSTVDMYSLANHLYGSKLVPEFIQHDATAENLSLSLLKLLNDKKESSRIIDGLKTIRTKLDQAGNTSAADVVFSMLNKSNKS